ncbi:sulfatase family protein [Labilibaculum antarcticum]|uniref:Sulfatase n=1 Tax=Labilibaculum antarcticum TaxID=1717717 RepID=A0A1Y1CLB7_9BACT|nr:sulfatase [Labilibaculum antarcticum]BAX81177.1 sulfatase [Labilibaculum antarcticum]
MNLQTLICLFTLPLLASCNQTAKKEIQRPNILFIMSDDHAYQAISAYNNTLTNTPNIDRIAQQGMRFTNACVTNSLCAPSRAVLLTGKHCHINGKVDNRFPFDTTQVTFPQLMQKAGYQTAMFGKLHFGNNPKGFDQFRILDDQGSYYAPDFFTKNEGKINIKGYTTDIITDMTIDWLKEERDPNKPFLLMLFNKAPHREWFTAPRHQAEYTSKTFKEPATLFDNFETRGTAAKTAEMNLADHMNWSGDSKIYPEVMKELGLKEYMKWDISAFEKEYNRMTPEERESWDKNYKPINEKFKKEYPNMSREDLMHWRYQRYMQDYLGCIAAVDEGVGRVLDCLGNQKLSDNTIVVYTSDQGFFLGEHGWFDKRFAYNESFKTPLLIKWPNVIKPGITNDEMVQNLDFAQTILDAAGLSAPEDMQGESLVPLFKGQNEGFREEVYYHYYAYPSIHMVKRHYAIVSKEYKLIHFYYDVDEWELYDRKNDPNEINNVYNDPAYAEIVDELKIKLSDIRIKYKDSDKLDQKYMEASK